MKLIVGLGNPGDKYRNTRHNAGFLAVEQLVEYFDLNDFKKADKFKAELAEGQIAGEKVVLAKPQTFMNLSGQSVQALQSYYKLDVSDILVIYDDVEIPLGKLRVRPSGSAGGHNGMASVMQELATLEVARIRIGIKPEKPFRGALEDFVLGVLTEDEKAAFAQVFSDLPALIKKLIEGEIDEVMQEYN